MLIPIYAGYAPQSAPKQEKADPNLPFKFQDLGFRVQDLRFRVLGFRV